ncbi:MAG: hypothetical protein ACREJP_11235 [Candidatus Methylomirabilales bacterium]
MLLAVAAGTAPVMTKYGAKRAPKKGAPAPRARKPAAPPSFPKALAALLRSRNLKVPARLGQAPPEAYAHQPASFVERLAALGDPELVAHAQKIAGYAKRHAERAGKAWDTSPLIAELRRRKLKEPPQPIRVVGAAFSLKRPLSEWTNREILAAAREWSRRGGGQASGSSR